MSIEADVNNVTSPGSRQASEQTGGPLVSVVIPVYQSSPFIVHTLNAVLAQTYTNYEIIVVNDGSPDTELLEQFLKPYLARIRYIKQENLGPSAARNAAILAARGEFVAFLDSDDLWLPHHLQSQVDLLQSNPSLSLVYSNTLMVEEDIPIGKGFQSDGQKKVVTVETLLTEECTIGTSTVVASRQAILETGLFDITLRRCEDFDLWVRMVHRGFRIDYDPGVQTYYRRNRTGLSANRELMMLAQIEVFERFGSLPISLAQRELLTKLIAGIRARLDIELAKKSLLAREYDAALQSAKRAAAAIDNWKLQVAILGVRYFPRLFRETYRAYDYVLSQRRRLGYPLKDPNI